MIDEHVHLVVAHMCRELELKFRIHIDKYISQIFAKNIRWPFNQLLFSICLKINLKLICLALNCFKRLLKKLLVWTDVAVPEYFRFDCQRFPTFSEREKTSSAGGVAMEMGWTVGQ